MDFLKDYEKTYLAIYLFLVAYYFINPELCFLIVIALTASEIFEFGVDIVIGMARQMQALIELDRKMKAG